MGRIIRKHNFNIAFFQFILNFVFFPDVVVERVCNSTSGHIVRRLMYFIPIHCVTFVPSPDRSITPDAWCKCHHILLVAWRHGDHRRPLLLSQMVKIASSLPETYSPSVTAFNSNKVVSIAAQHNSTMHSVLVVSSPIELIFGLTVAYWLHRSQISFVDSKNVITFIIIELYVATTGIVVIVVDVFQFNTNELINLNLGNFTVTD